MRNHVIQNGREFRDRIPASDNLVGLQHEQFVKRAAKQPACGFIRVDYAQGLAVDQQRSIAAHFESAGKPLLPSLSPVPGVDFARIPSRLWLVAMHTHCRPPARLRLCPA